MPGPQNPVNPPMAPPRPFQLPPEGEDQSLRAKVLRIPHVLAFPYSYSDEDLDIAIKAGQASPDAAVKRVANMRAQAWAAVQAAKSGDPALIYKAMDAMNACKEAADQLLDAPGKPGDQQPPPPETMSTEAMIARQRALGVPSPPIPGQPTAADDLAAASADLRKAEAEIEAAQHRMAAQPPSGTPTPPHRPARARARPITPPTPQTPPKSP